MSLALARRIIPSPSLHVMVIAAIVLVCSMLVGLDGWRTWQDRVAQIAEAKAETANLARSLAQHAHDTIQLVDTAVVGLRDAVETNGRTPKTLDHLSRLMAAQVAALPVIHGLFVFDAAGTCIVDSVSAKHEFFNGSDQLYFQHHRLHPERDVHVGNPVHSKVDGSWIITVSRRLDAADGSFAGVVLATISVEFLQDFYATFDVGTEGVIALDSADGILIARMPSDGAPIGADLSGGQIHGEFLRRSPVGSFEFISAVDGLRRLGSYRRVDDFPLVIVVARGFHEALAGWRAAAMFHLSISAGAAAILASLGSRLALQIRKRQQAEISVRLSERHYRLLADNSTDLITQLKPDLKQVYASPACKALLGYSPQELIGLHPSELLSVEDWPAFSASLVIAVRDGHAPAASYRMRRKDGTKVWVETTGRKMDDGRGFVFVTRDITQRKAAEKLLREANKRLERLVMLDGLTGIANRRCFDVSLEMEYRRAERTGTALALLLIDVDHFKAFNDIYGHPVGDTCLRAIAECINLHMQRPADLTARYGGEEFVVLLPDTESEGAIVLADRIREAIRGLHIAHRKNVDQIATVSIGVAVVWPKQKQQTMANLLEMADAALYDAKASGRDRVCCGAPAQTFTDLLSLRTDITSTV